LNSNSSRDINGHGFLPSIKSNKSKFKQELDLKKDGGENSYKILKQADPLTVFKQLRESEDIREKGFGDSKKNYGRNNLENNRLLENNLKSNKIAEAKRRGS